MRITDRTGKRIPRSKLPQCDATPGGFRCTGGAEFECDARRDAAAFSNGSTRCGARLCANHARIVVGERDKHLFPACLDQGRAP